MRALGQREILASQLRKVATKLAENSSQFAVWSLNRDNNNNNNNGFILYIYYNNY
jgi:hypothetical protein